MHEVKLFCGIVVMPEWHHMISSPGEMLAFTQDEDGDPELMAIPVYCIEGELSRAEAAAKSYCEQLCSPHQSRGVLLAEMSHISLSEAVRRGAVRSLPRPGTVELVSAPVLIDDDQRSWKQAVEFFVTLYDD